MDVIGRLSFFASLYNVHEQPVKGMWLLYATIVVLSIIVYRLGFARELPLLKNVIIYSLLVLGCTILAFFAVFLPVAEGLLVAAVVLIIYKWRLRREGENTE
ncbi:hypothetical protein LH47_02660 [Anoxybacillus thermarum]|uniref:YlaH-like protein n=1 Tax=Anoxybacillus thermarum TaxID=404937 RepID=A0A0D0RV02_9BACL|nr:YlaH-like family protein [Anoxybacillus thermarum]KIQ93260.1 hypothetical protein LH47_02660 [Anoxybacillus thermarum]